MKIFRETTAGSKLKNLKILKSRRYADNRKFDKNKNHSQNFLFVLRMELDF